MSFLNLTSHTTLYYFCIFISGKGFISKIYSLIYYLLVITAIFFSIHNYLLLHQCRKNFISYGLKLCDLLASFLMRSKSELLLTAGSHPDAFGLQVLLSCSFSSMKILISVLLCWMTTLEGTEIISWYVTFLTYKSTFSKPAFTFSGRFCGPFFFSFPTLNSNLFTNVSIYP